MLEGGDSFEKMMIFLIVFITGLLLLPVALFDLQSREFSRQATNSYENGQKYLIFEVESSAQYVRVPYGTAKGRRTAG